MKTFGWLFDLYPLGDRMVLWFITSAGQRLRLEDDFRLLRLSGRAPGRSIRSLARGLGQRGWLRRAYPSRGQDLWTGREIPVVALEVKAYGFLPRLRKYLGALAGEVVCYNCDLDLAAYYLYVRRYWPCAWYEVEAKDGRLLHLEAQEDPFAVEFAVPPLATLTLGLTRDPLIPLGAGNGLAVGWEGRTLELEAPDRPGLVRELAQLAEAGEPGPGVERLGRRRDHPHPRPVGAGNIESLCPWTGKRGRRPGGSAAAAATFPTAASSIRARRPLSTAAGTWTGATLFTTGSRA